MKNRIRSLLPQTFINLVWHLPNALCANIYYGFPARKLALLGVTGTDGKTSTAFILFHLLKKSGFKSGLVCTVCTKIGSQTIPSPLHTTSLGPWQLQKTLHLMVKRGVSHVVLEATSIGLHQYRFLGCHFLGSVFTNLTHEHLDYHKTMAAYLRAKLKLLALSQLTSFNQTDHCFKAYVPTIPPKKTVVTYSVDSQHKADYMAKNIITTKHQTTLHLHWQNTSTQLTTNTVFPFQVENMLAALSLLLELKLLPPNFPHFLAKLPPVPGRIERVDTSHHLNLYIDFAHTPNGLTKLLGGMRQTHKQARLIVVFGATGGRDRSKRPLMGKVVAGLADIAILTADDSRTEQTEHILEEIKRGIPEPSDTKGFAYYLIPNRQQAINRAVELARPGDTIVLCGKGHERSITEGTKEFPWSEQNALHTALINKYGHL